MKITYRGRSSAYQRCFSCSPSLLPGHLWWWLYCQSYGSISSVSAGKQWAVSSNNVGSVTLVACSRFNASNGHILSSVQTLECQHLWDTNKYQQYFRWICSLMLVTFDANQSKVASPIMFWCVNKRPELVHFHQSKVTESFQIYLFGNILEFQECNVKNGPFAVSYFYTSKRRRLEFSSPWIFCFAPSQSFHSIIAIC